MPNWVYNNIQASGTIADIQAFLDKAGKPHTTEFTGKRFQDESGAWQYDADAIVVEEDTDPFSFWNFIRPDEEILPVYFGHIKADKPEGYEDWSMEDKFAHDLKFTGNNSYDWNVRNWGTKWDASDQSVDEPYIDEKSGKASVGISFSTAWGIPEPIFVAICEQHPELDFTFDCEEEQGWGATFESTKVEDAEEGEATSTLLMTDEWDIPSSHEDYAKRGRDCWACDSGDEEDLYDDCPREAKEFAVVVSRTYFVSATNAEAAWEVVQEKLLDGEPELPEGFTIADEDNAFVKDAGTDERLFPIFEGV